MNKKNKRVIFGTGSSSFSFLRSFSGDDVLLFLDNDETKHYTLYNNRPVLPPKVLKELDKEEFQVIIASEFYNEISLQLENYGLIANRDFLSMKEMLLKRSDVFLISYMKCGRTWLRYIIGILIENIFGLINDDKLIYTDCYSYNIDSPIITAYHDDSPHLKTKNELEKNKSEYENSKVIFMVRDPRDVAVSLFYHMKFRSKTYNGDIDEFVVNKIPSIVEYFNIWYNNRSRFQDFEIVRYEDLHNNPQKVLTNLGSFLGFKKVDENVINNVIEASSFSKMKEYENNSKSGNTQLNSSLAKSKNAAKVRKGKVKGYITELKQETINNMDAYIKVNLNSSYGY